MIRPASEQELAEALRAARGPLRICGGGTRSLIAGPGEVLQVSGLSGITLYEPGALTMVARAGTPLALVEETLAAEGQRLPFEPPDMRGLLGTSGTPTIGGVFAAGASGPRRVQAGAARDFALGVRLVDGSGRLIRNGGRVMKNVTGYDLVRLMCGARGTLGVLVEIAFKVLPAPEAAATLLVEGLDPARAVAAMSAALGSPYDVSGAAHTLAGLDGRPVTMLRVEGFEGLVAARAERLRHRLAEVEPAFAAAEVETDTGRIARGWASVRDVTPFRERMGDVWRLSLRPSDAPAVLEAIAPEGALLDWGGALLWALVEPGRDIRPQLAGLGVPGHATLVRAAPETLAAIGAFHPRPARLAALEAGLRARFDPRGILNPGLMAA